MDPSCTSLRINAIETAPIWFREEVEDNGGTLDTVDFELDEATSEALVDFIVEMKATTEYFEVTRAGLSPEAMRR